MTSSGLSFDARTVRGLLFDLDGTLVDSLPDLHYGVERMLERWELKPVSEEVVGSFVGKGIPHLARCILSQRMESPTEEDFCRFQMDYVSVLAENRDARTRLMPGVMEAMTLFEGEGLPMALVTNKAGVLVDSLLDRIGLGRFIAPSMRVSADDVEHAKPWPDMLQLAATRMGVPVSGCLMIGDSRNDAEAARRAGCPVILLTTGYNEGEPVEVWGPAHGFCDIFPSIDKAARAVLAPRS